MELSKASQEKKDVFSCIPKLHQSMNAAQRTWCCYIEHSITYSTLLRVREIQKLIVPILALEKVEKIAENAASNISSAAVSDL